MSQSCLRCNRALKDPESVSRGYGPMCWARIRAEMYPGSVKGMLDSSRVPYTIQNGYAGIRTLDGCLVVVVKNGHAYILPHFIRHSPSGYEWGYYGSGPADLALNILRDAIGPLFADKHYQLFKSHFVAHFSDQWEITTEQVREWYNNAKGDSQERKEGNSESALHSKPQETFIPDERSGT